MVGKRSNINRKTLIPVMSPKRHKDESFGALGQAEVKSSLCFMPFSSFVFWATHACIRMTFVL